jgi:hypothetical protein
MLWISEQKWKESKKKNERVRSGPSKYINGSDRSKKLNLRRSTKHGLLGSACFWLGIIFIFTGLWSRDHLSRSWLVCTVTRTFLLGTRTYRTINHSIERVNTETIIGSIFCKAVLTRWIFITSSKLNDTFIFDASVQVFETSIIGICCRINVWTFSITRLRTNFASDTKITISWCATTGDCYVMKNGLHKSNNRGPSAG